MLCSVSLQSVYQRPDCCLKRQGKLLTDLKWEKMSLKDSVRQKRVKENWQSSEAIGHSELPTHFKSWSCPAAQPSQWRCEHLPHDIGTWECLPVGKMHTGCTGTGRQRVVFGPCKGGVQRTGVTAYRRLLSLLLHKGLKHQNVWFCDLQDRNGWRSQMLFSQTGLSLLWKLITRDYMQVQLQQN